MTMFRSHVEFFADCPSCGQSYRMRARHVTVTPSYVGFPCLWCGLVWAVEPDVNTRLWLVESGADWWMDDPLTSGDVEDLVNELVWAARDFGDRLVEALEMETR